MILSPERAQRPYKFGERAESISHPEYDPKCPFCPGNEAETPKEVFALRDGSAPDTPGWRVRVVENKFPALSLNREGLRATYGLYRWMEGVGRHEVIIESPIHNRTPALMSIDEVKDLLTAYHRRYLELSKGPRYPIIIIFRNQGPQAGTSLAHPHSQLIASPVVPRHIRYDLKEAERYWDDQGSCVYCDLMKFEVQERARLVSKNDDFLGIAPYASTLPYELWILPRVHQASFGELPEVGIEPLAWILRDCLRRLYRLLNNPDYNYVIHSAPHSTAGQPHYHWHLEILPRLTTRAGFEIGSGMYINIVAPEVAAERLRSVQVEEER
jgi:UDPglucose--hexose-1-phosphate uridylyltransferase